MVALVLGLISIVLSSGFWILYARKINELDFRLMELSRLYAAQEQKVFEKSGWTETYQELPPFVDPTPKKKVSTADDNAVRADYLRLKTAVGNLQVVPKRRDKIEQ